MHHVFSTGVSDLHTEELSARGINLSERPTDDDKPKAFFPTFHTFFSREQPPSCNSLLPRRGKEKLLKITGRLYRLVCWMLGGSRLQAAGSRLQAPGSRLPAPGSRLQVGAGLDAGRLCERH